MNTANNKQINDVLKNKKPHTIGSDQSLILFIELFNPTHLSQQFLHGFILFFFTLYQKSLISPSHISPSDLILITLASKFCESLNFKFQVQLYRETSNWRLPLHPAFCSPPATPRKGPPELRCSGRSTRFGLRTPGFSLCPDSVES